MSNLPSPEADQARRNKRLAWIHVGIALVVLAVFVINTALNG